MDVFVGVLGESIYFFEIILIIFTFQAVMEYRGKKVWLGVILQPIIIYSLHKVLTLTFVNMENVRLYSSVGNFIVFQVVTIIFYKGGLGKRFWATCIYVLPAWIFEPIALGMTYDIAERIEGSAMNLQMLVERNEYLSLAIIFCGQGILILWGVALLFWKVFIERKWIKEYLLFMILPVYKLILLTIYYYSCVNINVNNLFIGWSVYLIGGILDFLILYLVSEVIKKWKLENEIGELNHRREEELKCYLEMDKRIKEIGEIRHEYFNQLQVIYRLIEERNKEKLNELLKDICNYLDGRKGNGR